MTLGTYCKLQYPRRSIWKGLLLLLCLNIGQIWAQKGGITINEKNAPLEKIFKEIKRQTGVSFVYREEWLQQSKRIDITISNATLEQTLNLCFKDQPFTYAIVENTVVIRQKPDEKKAATTEPKKLVGSVVDKSTGKPLAGATIVAVPTGTTTISDNDGQFELKNAIAVQALAISYTGYNTEEINVRDKAVVTVSLTPKVAELDEVVQIAYGTTSKRYNTGSVAKISAADIEKQPVSNPLAALEGRVPGLVITQTTGVTGGAFKVQIRGQNSIAQGSDPLFIIDGVPFTAGNTSLSQLGSAVGLTGISPFSTINPADIDEISVLKDADATAIYGSRGANGVVLITTKKGKAGKTTFSLNGYLGNSVVTRTIPLMNTQQYLTMRNEAFNNDGKTPTTSTAPDLLVWDTSKYTDFTKMFIGGTARTSDVNASISGGNGFTKFVISGTYHNETSVFPGELNDVRGAMHAGFNHVSIDKKFSLDFQANYVSDKNILPSLDLTSYTTFSPNAPSLLDSVGNLIWYYKGYSLSNPLAYLFQPYKSVTDNLISNLALSYRILNSLTLKVTGGYNTINSNETSILPISSLDPTYSPLGSSSFGNSWQKGWIVEPQLLYNKTFRNHFFDVIVGATYQNINSYVSSFNATGYTSDALLNSITAASSLTGTSSNAAYKYAAFFGRVNYRFKNTYVLNLTVRRDGSSRFGPEKQWASFGAFGGAWIFSNESFVKQVLQPLSFGKLRISYGSTGNDQIGNYQFYDTWSPFRQPYQQTTGLQPTRLFNPDYAWEINKKLEAALELGFLHDRILITGAWFHNRSDNQLVQYALPTQTGFTSILANLPATVQNTGIELLLNTKNIVQKTFAWSTMFTITIPRNKLIAFPNLSTSSYAAKYVVGEPLTVINALKYRDVDPAIGVYRFEDVNNDGAFTSKDYQVLGYAGPKVYGGFNNTLDWKGWALDIFFEGRKQVGPYYMTNSVPGILYYNRPVDLMSRWQKNGDITNVQQFSTTSSTAAYKAQTVFNASNAIYTDASYIRLKNLSISYSLPQKWISKAKLSMAKLYVRAQNLLTITSYKGSDPETLSYNRLPTLRTIVYGIQLTL